MKRETYLDKEIGYIFTTLDYTITAEDLDKIYDFLGQRELFFVDDNFAKSLELKYQGKIVAGIFLLLLASKLDTTIGLTFNAILAGMNDIKFTAPAYPGDRLRLIGELLKKKTTSKGHVFVDWKWTLKNQNDIVIASGINSEMYPNATLP